MIRTTSALSLFAILAACSLVITYPGAFSLSGKGLPSGAGQGLLLLLGTHSSGFWEASQAIASETGLSVQNPEKERLLGLMGRHMRQGEVEEAIGIAQAVLEKNPSLGQIHADLEHLQYMENLVQQRLLDPKGLEFGTIQGRDAKKAEVYLETHETGQIDYTNGMLRAKGVAGFPNGFEDPEKAAELAQKKAIERGLYKLLTLMYLVRIDEAALVGDRIIGDNRYRESIRNLLGRAELIEQRSPAENTIEVTVQMPFHPLYDPEGTLLWKADLAPLTSQKQDGQQSVKESVSPTGTLGSSFPKSSPEHPATSKEPPSTLEYAVFSEDDHFKGSPLEPYGRRNLFQVHALGENEIAVLEKGCESLAARIASIRDARKSIRIQSLIFSGDESGRHIADILKQKKQQGLDVRIIIDELSNPAWRDQMMYYDLQRTGIPVEGYEALFLQWIRMLPPLNKMMQQALEGKPVLDIDPDKAEIPYDPVNANKRYHEKMWIVDGETDFGVAIIGGRNIANEYFSVDEKDPRKRWRDQDVMVRGSILQDMVTAFDRTFRGLWQEKEDRLISFNKTWEEWNKLCDMVGLSKTLQPRVDTDLMNRVHALAGKKPDLEFQPVKARFFQNQSRLGETYITQTYLSLLGEAQDILIANAYFIPSKNLIESIKNAVRRGASVKLVTNSLETNDLPDITIIGRHYYREILSVNDEPEVKKHNETKAEGEPRAQVEIWEWQGEMKNGMGTMHAKYAVFDRKVCLIGSHNLDPRSEHLNSETAILLESKAVGEKVASVFYETDLKHSQKITPEEAEHFHDPGDIVYKMRKAFGRLFEDML